MTAQIIMAAMLAFFVGVSAVRSGETGVFIDGRDGKTYKTVQIGNQTWMAQNLNYQTGKSWCYGNEDSYCKKYGRLYDWTTAKTACPAGFRLPSREEWDTLAAAAGGGAAGRALKSSSGWGYYGNGIDSYGFSALPGGVRSPDGSFFGDGKSGLWWTAAERAGGQIDSRDMNGGLVGVSENQFGKDYGLSVRCVKPERSDTPNRPQNKAPERSDTLKTMGTFTDGRDGQTYKTAEIGGQTWTAQNMNYQTESGSWCYKDSNSYCKKYGRLYDWTAAKTACPAGFHLPSRQEWQTLVDYAGGNGAAGGKLKAKSGWSNYGGGTDDYGFSALPGGFRGSDDHFGTSGTAGYWWTSAESGGSHAYHRDILYYGDEAYEFHYDKNYGYSARCVKDE
ncbi:hypothetical protein R80B4_02813 [Fibrobacteres bacterium R8-0-B4]